MSERGSDREGPDGQTRMTLRPRAKDKRRRELVPVVERLPISRGGVARGRRSRDARSEKKGEEIVFEQRRLDTITCDGNYYGLIAFHNTVKGVMYGESGFV